MPNKAFIFDMDGVLVDSERSWEKVDKDFLDRILGKDISKKIGSTIGFGVSSIYEKAKNFGFVMDPHKFQSLYDEIAFEVYDRSTITPNVEDLSTFLLSNNFKIGLVSSSPTSWIDHVMKRISFGNKFKTIVSLNDHPNLATKPAPDGYLEAMKELDSTPSTTIVLEDSNPGIKSAKKSGSYTIGFRGNIVPGYIQDEADIYADHMLEVIEIIKNKFMSTE